MADALWVGLAGGVGAAARYVVDRSVGGRVLGRAPAGTLLVNATGSLLLGLVTGLVLFHGGTRMLTLVLGTGFCGGYTTFSAASFEAVRHLQLRRPGSCFSTALANLAGCLAAGALGLALAAS